MGSGGMSSGLGRTGTTRLAANTPVPPNPPQQQAQAQQQLQNQVPTPQNTPVVSQAISQLSQMSDAQLAALVRQSKGVIMPNHLMDLHDVTQEFVFTAGLNEKPVVLDDASFTQYMKDNNLTSKDLITRDVNAIQFRANNVDFKYDPQDVIDMMKYSNLNYIGGKHGGQAYGAGTYFDHTNGHRTGYGRGNFLTATAVLNPQTAKVIYESDLYSAVNGSWGRAHPQLVSALGRITNKNQSIYALAMGYNVISDSRANTGYVTVIDRAALVYKQSDF